MKSPTPVTLRGQLAGKERSVPPSARMCISTRQIRSAPPGSRRSSSMSGRPTDPRPGARRHRRGLDVPLGLRAGQEGARRPVPADHAAGRSSDLSSCSPRRSWSQPIRRMITRVLKVLLKGEELLTQNPQESQEATARYTRGALTVDQVKRTVARAQLQDTARPGHARHDGARGEMGTGPGAT